MLVCGGFAFKAKTAHPALFGIIHVQNLVTCGTCAAKSGQTKDGGIARVLGPCAVHTGSCQTCRWASPFWDKESGRWVLFSQPFVCLC